MLHHITYPSVNGINHLLKWNQWRSKGGAVGAVRPGRHFLGGGKIKVIPKNLEREKVFFGGEILGGRSQREK